MKAQILRTPKKIEDTPLSLEEVLKPEPLADEVRIRIHCCGVCLTDKHICEGELPAKCSEIIPGHQVVGVVEALGKGVNRFKLGDRVGAVWLASTCGSCRYCLSLRENLCENATFNGWDHNGGYAEYMVAKEEFIHLLRSEMTDEHIAPLLCAGVVGYRSLVISGAGKGSKLGLYGFGNSAHIILQIAKYIGASVYAFTRSEGHRLLAKKLGAAWVGDINDYPPERLDQAIVFAPVGEVVKKALLDLHRGGKIAINAIHMNDIPSIRYADLYYEKSIQSVTHGTRKDAQDLFSFLKECPVHTEVEIFSLSQVNEALLKQKQSKMEAAGVISIN
jgi:propanol-preferring alcohol dehydrogenase